MKRPGNVVAIAVIELAGSALTLGFAALVFLGAVLQAAGGTAATAGQAGRAIVGGVLCLGFAAWGIATGIELLRLRIWALVSTLLYAALLLSCGIMLAITGAALMAMAGSFPVAGVVAAGVVFLCLGLAASGLAAWWIATMVRPGTRAALHAARPQAVAPRRPLSISIIGFLLTAGGAAGILTAPFIHRTARIGLMGHIATGTGAQAWYVALGGASVVIGVYLLRLRPWARAATLAWLVLGIANGAVNLVLPRIWLQQEQLLQRDLRPQQLAIAAAVGYDVYVAMIAISIALTLVLLYFLWTRAAAFASATGLSASPEGLVAPPLVPASDDAASDDLPSASEAGLPPGGC